MPQISTKNWNKIWFSTDPKFFIKNKKYRNQIIRFSIDLKEKKYTQNIFFSSGLLDEDGKKDLKKFQQEMISLPGIYLIDIDSESFIQQLANPTEIALYQLAKKELDNIFDQQGGNPAAASDILRILSPCYMRGIYTDFDVDVSYDELPENDEAHLKSGFYFPTQGTKACNDVIGVAPKLTERGHFLLDSIQNMILKNYERADIVSFEPQERQFESEVYLAAKQRFADIIKTVQSTETGSAAIFKFRSLILAELQVLNQADKQYLSFEQKLRSCQEEIKRLNKAGGFEKVLKLKLKERQISKTLNELQPQKNIRDYLLRSFIESVMRTSGPQIYLQLINSQIALAICAKGELNIMTESQIKGAKNDALWIPNDIEEDIDIEVDVASTTAGKIQDSSIVVALHDSSQSVIINDDVINSSHTSMLPESEKEFFIQRIDILLKNLFDKLTKENNESHRAIGLDVHKKLKQRIDEYKISKTITVLELKADMKKIIDNNISKLTAASDLSNQLVNFFIKLINVISRWFGLSSQIGLFSSNTYQAFQAFTQKSELFDRDEQLDSGFSQFTPKI